MTQAKRANISSASPWLILAVIWVIGLILVAWQGWWMPGIVTLVVLSALVYAALSYMGRRTAETDQFEARQRLLPHNCPSCAGVLKIEDVRWTSSVAASCPYCGAALEFEDDASKLAK